jgi:hypothetical protein
LGSRPLPGDPHPGPWRFHSSRLFGIYPDWGNDIDLGVRNGLAGRVCQAINQTVGIPIYQAGVMSEKSTGVGISGFRLGIFLVTAALASLTTRLIIEHGAHTNPQDLAILQNPAQQKKIAEASAKAIITYFGDTIMSINTPQGDAVQMNGHTLGHGFLAYWKSVDVPGQSSTRWACPSRKNGTGPIRPARSL